MGLDGLRMARSEGLAALGPRFGSVRSSYRWITAALYCNSAETSFRYSGQRFGVSSPPNLVASVVSACLGLRVLRREGSAVSGPRHPESWSCPLVLVGLRRGEIYGGVGFLVGTRPLVSHLLLCKPWWRGRMRTVETSNSHPGSTRC